MRHNGNTIQEQTMFPQHLKKLIQKRMQINLLVKGSTRLYTSIDLGDIELVSYLETKINSKAKGKLFQGAILEQRTACKYRINRDSYRQ